MSTARELEQRILNLEQRLAERDDDAFKTKVAEVITRFAREYNREDIARQALAELGIATDEGKPEFVEFELRVVIRSNPSDKLIVEWDDEESVKTIIEESIPDLQEHTEHILDSDWSETEIHTVEVTRVGRVR